MKVLLRRNVSKLGKIGEVVSVKEGYARNFLLPQGLAVKPTEANVKAVEAEKERYLAELAKLRQELEVRAAALAGKEITIAARANAEGHLYGSVGPAQIAAVLAEQGVFVEEKTIRLDQPIRQLDKYDVTIEFGEEVTAEIHVWIVPIREENAEDEEESADAGEESAES
jgi:large subunit ribosomal protein L9